MNCIACVVHWLQNGGKCGVCGDAYQSQRLHETGGPYANQLLGARYAPGQIIDIDIELSANHQGYFEISLCPTGRESPECFEKLLFRNLNEIRYNITILIFR